MSDFGSGKYMTARKPHICDACYRAIPAGVEYYRSFGVHEGDTYTFKAHADCVRSSNDFAAEVCRIGGADYSEDVSSQLVYELENLALPHVQQVLDALRGRWPHVVCRLEYTFRANLARLHDHETAHD